MKKHKLSLNGDLLYVLIGFLDTLVNNVKKCKS